MKVMILGATELQIPLIKAARDEGYIIVVVAPNKNEPGFKYADRCEYCDVKDRDAVLKLAIKHEIDGIITDQAESPLRTIAYVAEQMGLSGNKLSTIEIFTDKYKQRTIMQGSGIPTIPFRLCHSIGEALDFYDELNSEVIIKPTSCQGSKGVYRISSKAELNQKYKEAETYGGNDAVLIEKFVHGKEYVVEGIAVGYDFQNLCIGESYYFDMPDVFSPNMRIFGLGRDDELEKRILTLNHQIVELFGYKQGLTHSEFIVSENGEIYLIEAAARGGGAYISSDIIPIASGVCSEKFLLNIAVGGYPKPEIFWRRKPCCYIAFFLPEGKICHISGIEATKKLPFVHKNNLDDFFVGKVISRATDKSGRGLIVIDGISDDNIYDNINKVRETLKIEVDDGQSIRGILWR